MFQECFLNYYGVSEKFQVCFRKVSRVFLKCFKCYWRKFEGSFRRVSRKFQNLLGCFKIAICLKVYCYMALISATWAEGVRVLLLWLILEMKNKIGTSVRRSSRSAFGRSTGNDVSGHYKRHYILFFFFFSSPSSTFLIEGVLGSKNLFRESWREHPKT